MQNSYEVEHRLGYRVLRWVLAVALISGVTVSTVQVILDAGRVSQSLDDQARQTMALVRKRYELHALSIPMANLSAVVTALSRKAPLARLPTQFSNRNVTIVKSFHGTLAPTKFMGTLS